MKREELAAGADAPPEKMKELGGGGAAGTDAAAGDDEEREGKLEWRPGRRSAGIRQLSENEPQRQHPGSRKSGDQEAAAAVEDPYLLVLALLGENWPPQATAPPEAKPRRRRLVASTAPAVTKVARN